MMKVVMFSLSLFFLITTIVPNARCDEFLFLYYSCSNTSNFKPDSAYNSSVNAVLDSFSSNSTSNSVGYYHTTAENTVHGYYLCRGDLDRAKCRACMSEALNNLPSTRAKTYCPRSTLETLYYDRCMFRYSSQTLYQQPSPDFEFYQGNPSNITGIPQDIDFKSFLREKLDDLASQAAKNETGKKYAALATYVGAFKPLFALAQCTPDLSVQDCYGCLLACNGRLQLNKEGEKFFVASCNVRYETNPFFHDANNLLASSPRPGRLPPVSNTAINNTEKRNISIGSIIGIVAAAAAIIAIILTSGVMCFITFIVKKMIANQLHTILTQHGDEVEGLTVESLQYNLTSLQSATNEFSEENKLGEGGFGTVYKGTLLNGKDIAVKRLSKSASQGEEQFKNEVLLVAKLQHRNLVRLLGYCLTEEEKLLIYEFVPNQSLDKFLFDPEMSKQLDWKRRYNIIEGIARGMLYLHEDSRLKIIHRDLKASNILIDAFMNPKVSDFGTARIFGVDQTKGSTKRVIGTYGYMAPEYVLYGQFSVKSDVYSFGILVLEIISGEKSTSFSEENDEPNLLSFAWKNWSNGTPLQFVDPCIRDRSSAEEVARCMQLGLLCVYQDANERPFMSTIVLMLSSLTASIPLPREPRHYASTDTHPTFARINHYSSTSDDYMLQLPAAHDDDVSLTLPR